MNGRPEEIPKAGSHIEVSQLITVRIDGGPAQVYPYDIVEYNIQLINWR